MFETFCTIAALLGAVVTFVFVLAPVLPDIFHFWN